MEIQNTLKKHIRVDNETHKLYKKMAEYHGMMMSTYATKLVKDDIKKQGVKDAKKS